MPLADAEAAPEAAGDAWTWTALDADTKLIVSHLVGGRDAEYAGAFMDDLAFRLANRVQLTAECHNAYLSAVEGAFEIDVDFAMLVKHYGESPEAEKRCSPGVCTGCAKTAIKGRPIAKHVSTSYVERQNLTMWMHMRRFTRRTNAFSKKFEDHAHIVALYTVWSKLVRLHKTLRVTRAMAAGLSQQLWIIDDVAALIDAAAMAPAKRGPYRKRSPEPTEISN